MKKYLLQQVRTNPLFVPSISGALGCCILAAHIFYLTHANSPLKPIFDLRTMSYIRFMMFSGLLMVVLTGLGMIEKRLRVSGHAISQCMLLRSYLAAAVFCLSITALNPPDLKITPHRSPFSYLIYATDLAPFFITNTIAYAFLLYAVFRLPFFSLYASRIGFAFLRLLKFPSSRWAALVFVWVFFAAYHMSWELFRHLPWIYDTIVQMIHAKFIASGQWTGVSPPVELRDFFPVIFMVNDGKWYSQYPPGHLLMLAAGFLVNNVAMVNPLLGACTCIAIWLLAKELYGAHVARIAALLCALCVYLIMLSSEYMSNATSLLMATLFLWGYVRVLNRPNATSALLAGAALGFCFITRPYSAFGLGLPAAMYACYLVILHPRKYLLPMAVMAFAFLAFFAFQLYYNAVTNGDPFIFGYQRVQGIERVPYNKLDQWTLQRFYERLQVNMQRLAYFNRILFEWPIPLPAGLLAFVFAVRGNRRDEKILFATIFSMFLSVQFVFNDDISWGPRLVYEIVGVLLVLCAKGFTMIPPLLRTLAHKRIGLRACYGSAVIVLVLFYAFSFQYNLKIPVIRALYDLNIHKEWNPKFYNFVTKNVTPPALVFVPEDQYVFVAFTNPPSRKKPIIFAQDFGKDNNKLMDFYKKRGVYVVKQNGASLTIEKIR